MRCEAVPLLATERSTGTGAIERAKRALRASIGERRSACSPAARDAAARAIAEHVLAMPAFGSARIVAVYAALPDEVPLDAVVAAALASGRVVAMPRMQGDRLRFARVESWRALERGRFGIPEPPAAAAEVSFARGDLVLLPGVAFDAHGGRLGRGGGHYDRALAALPSMPHLVGVGFAFQLVASVPMDVHDRRVEAVVCERGVTPCGPGDPPGDPS